jgi:hypothetical protein
MEATFKGVQDRVVGSMMMMMIFIIIEGTTWKIYT